MADSDSGEKTEEPTAKKLEKSREEGQLPRSKELSTALILVASACALLLIGETIAKALLDIMRRGFTLSRDQVHDTNHMFQYLGSVLSDLAFPMLIFLVIGVIAGIYGNLAIGGFNFSWKAASPKASKMNPLSGFKRMFGLNGLVELLKGIAKVAVVAVSSWFALSFFQDQALSLDQELFPLNFAHAMDLLAIIFTIMCCSLIPIVLIDVPYQKYKHNKELKMTKQEVKDEHKNTEGNPEIKGRQRRIQHEASQRRMMQDVPTADVVVTNPTHFSVALKYDRKGAGAPIVVAKGGDEMAFHIRKIAKAHDVTVLSTPPLARSLFHTTEVGDEIPEALFMAVAQVLAYVFQMQAFAQGNAERPSPLTKNLPIPRDLRY